MGSGSNLFWILATLFLFSCEKGATCSQLEDYVFVAEPDALVVSAGNNYTLAMTFYPVPARRMKFSDDIQNQISVRSDWFGWQQGEDLPAGETDVIEISAEKPLVFNLEFQAVMESNTFVLDFGRAGQLRSVPIGESIPLQIALRPLEACIADSGEDYALADFRIETR